MPDVWLSRINRSLEKLFNVKGGPTLVDIDPALRAVQQIGSGVENRYLEGWNRFIGSFAVAAVAAQFSRALIRNPANSNVVAVLESIYPFGATAQVDMGIENAQPSLGTVQAAGTLLRRLDARSGFSDAVCILSSDTNATQNPGAAFVPLRRNTSAEVIVTANQEITLLPNDGWWMVSDVVNVQLLVNIIWRERPIEQSESS